jgi:Na+-driven multidrug efflux pump
MHTEALLPVSKNESRYTIYLRIAKDISTLTFAIILSNSSTTLNNFVNALILSNLSPKEDSSAAAAIIFSSQAFYVLVASAFLYTIPALWPSEKEEQKKMVTNGIALAVLVSIPAAIVSYFTGNFFRYMGTQKQVCDIVDEYYSIYALFFPLTLLTIALGQIAISLKRRLLIQKNAILSVLLTSGFSLLFAKVWPQDSFSKVKIVAMSYCSGSLIRFLYYGFIFYRENFFEKWTTNILNTHVPLLCEMLNMGWKISIHLFSELGALAILPLLTVRLLQNNTENLAILNTMSQYFTFSIMIPLALSQAMASLVRGLSEKMHHDQIQLYGNCVLAMSTLYNVICLIVGLAIPTELASLFLNPDENDNAGMSGDFRAMFAMLFIGLLFNSYRDILTSALRPLGVVKPPMVGSLVTLWLMGIPSSILFAKYTDLGIAGILMGYFVGVVIGSLYLLRVWSNVFSPEYVQNISEDQNNETEKADCFTLFPCSFLFNAARVSSNIAYAQLSTDENPSGPFHLTV